SRTAPRSALVAGSERAVGHRTYEPLIKSQLLFQPVASEHDAEKCERFSDNIMLRLYNVEQDSGFRPTRPKIILF
ncbi:hypothetical protein, partial [Rhizobium johnstonii]|uniref:hypothetical protein n=1 Tax=Rhizobium johnstonii TaxID=3019933 RepID=UPI003F96BE99